MMTEIVAIAFKWINLSIFCGGGYYLFVTRMVPVIKQQMFAKKNEIARKQAHHKRLHHDLEQIDEQIVQQDLLAKRLLERVQQWRQRSSQLNKSVEVERARCKQLLKERIDEQRKQLRKEYGIVAVLPGTIDELKHEAIEHFSDEKRAQEFLDGMVTYLERRA